MQSPLLLGLSALLAVQVLAALVLGVGDGDLGRSQSRGPLLVLEREQIARIRIEAPEREPLVIQKVDGAWQIPALADFPAARFRVDELLDKLAKIEQRLPVATSEAAAARFKVASGDFERRLTLEGESMPSATLFLGDSPGFRRLFVRADGDQAIYEAELALFDASEKADDWTDKAYLHLATEDIRRLQLPDATLEQRDGTWLLADAAEGEALDQKSVTDALRKIAGLDFRGVITGGGEETGAISGQPERTIAIGLVSGDSREYRLYKSSTGEGEGEAWTLQVADQPYRFELAGYAAEGLTGIARATLLAAADQEAAAEEETAREDQPWEEEPAREKEPAWDQAPAATPELDTGTTMEPAMPMQSEEAPPPTVQQR